MVRIALNAQVRPGGGWGGVEQFLIGLINGLGRLTDGTEEYYIVVDPAAANWLKPYLGRNQQIVLAPRSPLDALSRSLSPLRMSAGSLWRKVRRQLLGTSVAFAPQSSGYFESLGVDLVHFPYQMFSFCNLPFIYNPHDLQHLHYPEFFKPEVIATREAVWPLACRSAAAVATDASWVKTDVSMRYSISLQKIFSIPMGPPTELYGDITLQRLAAVKAKFRLPEAFVFYPAQTWAHKNHLRLLDALVKLRDRANIVLHLVCTGRQNDYWQVIKARIRTLDLQNQVRFLGFVEPTDLRALYRLAQFVVYPSLFEGGGLPVLEAFHEGVAVTCSNVTSLPEYAGDAAFLFDPSRVDDIADALLQMSTDGGLRETLRQRGTSRVRLFNWERTARA